MSEAFEITREFLFKTNIHEITSISIEYNYDIVGSNIEGEFDITGDYRLHEISINKEDFSFKIPFTHEIKENIDLDSVELEITDFTYDFKNGDELSVHVEYIVTGEQSTIEFTDEKSLNEFLDNNNNAEVINLSDNEIKDEVIEHNKDVVDNTREEIISPIISDTRDINLDIIQNDENEIEIPKVINQNDDIDKNMILNSINKDDEFVKYHIHTVVMNDTIENICTKYGININTLKKYNTFDNLELNMKLLIPENEEN